MTSRVALAGLFAALLSACGTDNAAHPGDGGAALDLRPPPPDAALENAACEVALLDEWRQRPPSTGLASPSAANSYDAVIGKLMADFQVPGGAVAVMRNGRLVFAKGYGFADRDEPQAAHPDDLFRVASVSKQITAAAILKLVESGKLSLDDKAFDVLSGAQPLPGKTRNPKLSAITVKNLLQHTGGWNRDFTFDPLFISGTVAAALSQPGPADPGMILRYMLDKSPTYDAGTTYCYSNFGYLVLGRIIEARAGVSYSDFVTQGILSPLGAPRMTIGHSLLGMRADGEVHYYDYPGAPDATSVFPDIADPVPWPYGGYYHEANDANGGWIASPVDLLRFQRGVDGRSPPPDILSQQSIDAMVANPNVPVSCTADGKTAPMSDPSGYWYGFGWQVNKYGNWWHNGSLPGTATEVVRAMNGFGWAAFFNTRPADSNAFFVRLDQDLWTALGGARSWPDDNWFDQYAAWSEWTPAAKFIGLKDKQLANGNWPVRLEGRAEPGGGASYRAQFSPVPPRMSFDVEAGVDCLTYRQKQSQFASTGFAMVNLQTFKDADGRRSFQVVWAK